MTDTTPSIKERVNAASPKSPSRSRAKSTTHDTEGNASKADKKAQIKDLTSAITSKASADADTFADELYSESFLNRLTLKRKGIEALSFTQLQGKAKQKTAHVLESQPQTQITGSIDVESQIFACEDWLGDDDEWLRDHDE